MPFTKQIFLGAGMYSEMHIQELHELLDEALGIISGLQQPDYTPSAEVAYQNELLRRELSVRLNTIVEQIHIALLGSDSIMDNANHS